MRTPEEIREILKNKGISGYRLKKDLKVTPVGADTFLNGETKKPYKSTFKMYSDDIDNDFKTTNSYTEQSKKPTKEAPPIYQVGFKDLSLDEKMNQIHEEQLIVSKKMDLILSSLILSQEEAVVKKKGK